MAVSPASRISNMKTALRRVGVGIGVFVSLLLVGATALFKESVYGPPYAQVFASRSSADVTLFSGSNSELRHTFRLSFTKDVGNPKHCAENEDDVCVHWEKSAKLLVTKGPKDGMRTVSVGSSDEPLEICFSLEGHQLYGGMILEKYPAQRVNLTQVPYMTGDVSRMGRNQEVLERYWFTSGGLNIQVQPNVPLFISQNEVELCLIAKNEFPYSKDVPIQISYSTCSNTSNAREAVNCFFPTFDKPVPPKEVIASPIWSTWVEFKKDINQTKVMQFEENIRKHGFNASVIEVDDAWETCYGSQTFDANKFPDPKAMVDQFHNLGHLVTFWVHPFIGPGCDTSIVENYKEKVVRSADGSLGITTWWNGVGSLIDFLNPDTTKWYINRLENIQKTYGIDGFKFDAGEAAYLPGMSLKEQSATYRRPNLYTTRYVEMASHFGTLTEVRVGAEANKFKLMQRLQDTNSIWESGNLGLRSVIKSVIQLSMMGYGAILPDMVGGNCYNNQPSKELFIRWIQLNTFLPVIQFSLTPWSFDEETINITKKFTSLHYAYTERILQEFNDNHHQVINPIWWISPEDKIAQVTSSEFLLGENLLVAPVLEEHATGRDIYLPVGTWEDQNTGKIYKGPATLINYPAPLDVLPYFERINKA